MTTDRICAVVLAMGALSCAGPVDPGDGGPTEPAVVSSAPYLGETPPGTEAVIFAPGTVSIEGRYEYAMSIHPDGDRLLFTIEEPQKGAAVYTSSIVGGSWTQPSRLDLTDGAMTNEMEAFFSPDGEKIFFAPFCKGLDVRIWSADVTADGFINPQPLGDPVARDPAFYPVQTANDVLYYTNLKERAVFRTTVEDGKLLRTEPAGLSRGGHAYPSADGSFVLLDSASLDSEEQRDIFVAFRNDDGSWGSPRALGSTVNTEHSETCPSLSPDGEYLFFSRYNEPGELSNLYWVSSKVIDAHRNF